MNSPPEICRRMRIALGTTVVIEASTHAAGAASQAAAAVASAFAAIARVEYLLHPSRAGSDLALINAAACASSVGVRKETLRVLALARRVHQASEGVFDPCTPSASGRFSDIEIADDGSVRCRAPVSIDLGGIAKGFAVDLAIEALQESGCRTGFVNAGGDMRAFGHEAHQIIVRRAAGVDIAVTLCDSALAVSDIDADGSGRPPEHRGYYSRCFDERNSREPGLHQRFAAVTAAEAALADALTKCVLLGSPGMTSRLMTRFGASLIATNNYTDSVL
ncbi:MAG TPA: FAD:protein FMN transferase [Steroidobacteraceae bacterium]|nr:FAD:protein FMN transferase [Steroidobacteraceae bacterium]